MQPLVALAAITGILACSGPATAAELSGDVGLVSDYRFRGISLSSGQPAVQASLSLEGESGLHLGIWASTIRDPGSKTDAEVDLYAGYGVELSEEIGIDFMATYYAYPSDGESNYLEGSATLALTSGIIEAGLGLSFVPKQSATEDDERRRRRNSYFFAQAAIALPDTPVKLTAAAGYERGFFDEADHGGKWDWTAGVEIALSPIRAAVAYIGSDAPDKDDCLVASLFFDF
jgi:uncharacterized protein (TIGR02001 family)